jgi:hypothetical protein
MRIGRIGKKGENIRYIILNVGTFHHLFASYGSALSEYDQDSLEGNFTRSFDDVFLCIFGGLKHIKGETQISMDHTKILKKIHVIYYQIGKRYCPKSELFLQISGTQNRLRFLFLFSYSPIKRQFIELNTTGFRLAHQ